MGLQMLLGTAVGLVVAVVSWAGNRTPHVVSTFPDFSTFLVLLALTWFAVWLCVRKSQVRDVIQVWKIAGTIAVTAGFSFGLMLVLVGMARFDRPAPLLLAFGFLTAFGSSLLCGAAASLIVSQQLHRSESRAPGGSHLD
jgi:hypothetical protein